MWYDDYTIFLIKKYDISISKSNQNPIFSFYLQGYQLCVMDYDFMILNNAFLIHRPGFKTAKSNQQHTDKPKVAAQNDFIKKIIIPELKQLYGSRKGCEK